MMGVGFLMMLALVTVPILLVAGIVWLLLKDNAWRQGTQPAAGPVQSAPAPTDRVCSHCQARLQPEWAHCPQCGTSTGV